MNEIEKYVQEKLFELQDEKYRDFHAALMPVIQAAGNDGRDESTKGYDKCDIAGETVDVELREKHNYTSFLKGLYHAAGKRTSR